LSLYDEDALAIERGLELLASDPLSMFKTTSPGQRLFIDHLPHRIYLHAANKWGKTTIGVASGLALAQGRKTLDGRPLPRLPSPNVGAIFSLDYKQQRLSVQETLLRLLGTWPHKCEWDGQTLVSVAVKPGFGNGYWASAPPLDDPRTWSKIGLYSQKNLQSGTGFRLHWACFDEPPIMSVYREVLKAGYPGWPFPTFITATSLKRSQWFPLRPYFPLEAHHRLLNGVIRIQGSVYENEALTAEDIADLERRYAPDPDRDARLYGKEMNSEGASPFRSNIDELRRWMDRAIEPTMRDFRVEREILTDSGKELIHQTVMVDIYEPFRKTDRYRLIVDPSLGIDDGLHDPGEATIFNMTRGYDVARYNGYLGEYGLAILAAAMARAYGEAMVDPEMGGGIGSGFLSGLRAAKYGRIVNSARSGAGMGRNNAGFVLSTDTRMEFAAALNEALWASSQGHPWLQIRSLGILTDLVDLIVDDKDRPITPAGTHDEGFITAGRAATLLAPQVKRRTARPETPKVLLSIRERGMKAYRAAHGIPEPKRSAAARRPRPRFRGAAS